MILEHYQSVFTNNDIKPTGNTIYYILTTVIVSPIIEELFYRKFLLKKLTNKYNLTTALIISSFCFSIIHIQTPNNLITAFIVGIIFGLIYMHTKKIGYTIILHTIINLIIIIPNNIGYSYDNWFFGTKFDGIYWLLFIIGIMITYLGVYKILKAKQNKIRD